MPTVLAHARWLGVITALLVSGFPVGYSDDAAPTPIVAVAPMYADSYGAELALDGRNHHAFVASNTTLRMFDSRTGALLHTQRVASGDGSADPPTIALDARDARVFVGSDNEYMLDANTGRLLRRVDTGHSYQIAVDETAGRAYISYYNGGGIIVEARTGRIVGALHIQGGDLGQGMAIDARTGRGFAAESLGAVDVFDTQTGALVRTVVAGNVGAVDERDGRVFLVGGPDPKDELSVLDARSGRVVQGIRTGHGALGTVAVDEATGRVFTANGDGTTTMLDARDGRVLCAVALETSAEATVDDPRLAVDARSGRIIVADQGGVSVLDARTGALVHHNTLRLPGQWSPASALTVDEQSGRILALTSKGLLVLDEARL